MNESRRRKLKGELALLTTAVFWGSGFIAVDYALTMHMGPAFINAARFFIGALVILAFCGRRIRRIRRRDLAAGAVAGLFFFLAFYLVTLALRYTVVSVSALLTATNILMVPFIMRIWFKRRLSAVVFAVALLCFGGVLVLSYEPGVGLRFGIGEVLALLCALFSAAHICYVGAKTDDHDPLIFTFVQLSAVFVYSAIVFVATELPTLEQVQWFPTVFALLYLGIFPTALCLFLQTLGQRYTPAAPAAITLSAESLFGCLFSVLWGLEPLTAGMLIGGGMIITSVVLVQLLPQK